MLREYNSGDGGLDDNVEMMTTTTVMTKMMGAKVMMLTMFSRQLPSRAVLDGYSTESSATCINRSHSHSSKQRY